MTYANLLTLDERWLRWGETVRFYFINHLHISLLKERNTFEDALLSCFSVTLFYPISKSHCGANFLAIVCMARLADNCQLKIRQTQCALELFLWVKILLDKL